ncbi:hypothetical protein STEG23_028093, partial [Scotinomys teguina]
MYGRWMSQAGTFHQQIGNSEEKKQHQRHWAEVQGTGKDSHRLAELTMVNVHGLLMKVGGPEDEEVGGPEDEEVGGSEDGEIGGLDEEVGGPEDKGVGGPTDELVDWALEKRHFP